VLPVEMFLFKVWLGNREGHTRAFRYCLPKESVVGETHLKGFQVKGSQEVLPTTDSFGDV
jgi:hypothetical protein